MRTIFSADFWIFRCNFTDNSEHGAKHGCSVAAEIITRSRLNGFSTKFNEMYASFAGSGLVCSAHAGDNMVSGGR